MFRRGSHHIKKTYTGNIDHNSIPKKMSRSLLIRASLVIQQKCNVLPSTALEVTYPYTTRSVTTGRL